MTKPQNSPIYLKAYMINQSCFKMIFIYVSDISKHESQKVMFE